MARTPQGHRVGVTVQGGGIVMDFETVRKSKSGYETFDLLKDNPLMIVRAGEVEAAAAYLDKARERHNTAVMGNGHPYNRIDPNQPQTRVPFLVGNLGGEGTEDDDDYLRGIDAEFGLRDTSMQNLARYVAVAPRNVSTTLRYLDFEARATGSSKPADRLRQRLSRFVKFLSRYGYNRVDLGDDLVLRFRHWLEIAATAQKPESVVKETARTWNRAATSVPGWPQQVLADIWHRGPYTWPWDALPASLRGDAEAWLETPISRTSTRRGSPSARRRSRHAPPGRGETPREVRGGGSTPGSRPRS